jgi:hypothetical protein
MNIELTAFQARNYKPFKDTGWVEIKPITLAFGHNSSGKSALLSILPMLKQTIYDPDFQTPFIFASDIGVDLGDYEDVSYQHKVSLDSPIWFNLELSLFPDSNQRKLPSITPRRFYQTLEYLGITKNIQLKVAANYNKKKRQIAITDCYLFTDDKEIFRIYRKTTAANQQWHYEPEILEQYETRVFWHHFIPRLSIPIFMRIGKEKENDFQQCQSYTELSRDLTQVITTPLSQLVHIGPLREIPRRAYRLTGGSSKDVGLSGENWLNILIRANSRVKLTENVNYWLKRLGYSLRIEWGKQGYVHPMLKDDKGLEVSLKDTGFGISQVLPLLIQGFSSIPGTILILEQPEIHLHPRAQAELGDILVAISKRGVKLLVETHSEHILLRLQRRIAEGYFQQMPDIIPTDIAIYFIEQEEEGSKVNKILINGKGEFISPPEQLRTFFSDDYNEALKWSHTLAKISKASE